MSSAFRRSAGVWPRAARAWCFRAATGEGIGQSTVLLAFDGLQKRAGIVGAFVHVAMGTLVDAPGIRPTRHIFVGSKAPWFTITDDLPQYAEHVTPARQAGG
jgi:hypothetical protein